MRPKQKIVPVDRLERCTLRTFHERYLSKRRPVILTGLCDDWPARRKWTWRWLTKHCGETRVRVTLSNGDVAQIPLARYIDYVRDPDGYDVAGMPYLRDWNFLFDHPEMGADFSPPFFAHEWIERVPARLRPGFRWIYVGPAGSQGILHIDTSGTHAWLSQLIGTKHWKLYAPEDIPESYFGHADAFRPDAARFPALTTATCWEATLAPGEMIFVPYGWRHQVRNLTPSLALTCNYVDASNFDDCMRLLAPNMFGLRDALEQVLIEEATRCAEDRRAPAWERRWIDEALGATRQRKLAAADRLAGVQRQLRGRR